MIYFVVKVPLKKMNKDLFHDIVAQLHQMNDQRQPFICHYANGFIIDDEDVLAYHIEEEWIYDYIYNQAEQQLYISLNKKQVNDYTDLFAYLLEHDFIDESSMISQKAITLKSYKEIEECHWLLPIIYLHHKVLSPSLLEVLPQKLKGFAHVVYGDENFEKEMMNHYSFSDESYAILYNNDYFKLSKHKKESELQFVDRIFYKIQTYMTKRVFDYPYLMNDLYQSILRKMIALGKENEDNLTFDYAQQLTSLENKAADLENKIEKLHYQTEQVKNQIMIAEASLEDKNDYPMILKGDEKELYQGEQKDMLLYLIEEELKNEKEEHRIKLLQSILDANPKDGTRDTLLSEIRRILLSVTQLNGKAIDELNRVGVCLEKKEGHPDGTFFNDARYTITVSSSPSDLNSNRQSYRLIRKIFF